MSEEKKDANVVNSSLLSKAEFKKLFGDDPAMYISATEAEMKQYMAEASEDYYVFTVPREKPVTNDKFLPRELLVNKKFDFKAQPGEYYVFQVVVWAPESGLFNVNVSAPETDSFVNAGNVRSEELKIFWLGVDIPLDYKGVLSKEISVSTDNMGNKTVKLDISVEGEPLLDKGESDDNKMARLRWVKSDIGKADTVFAPYIPVKKEGKAISWLGHTVILGENGLPESITSEFSGKVIPLLNAPIEMESDAGKFEGKLQFVKESQTRVEWTSEGKIGGYDAKLCGSLEFDGYLDFSVKTKAAGSFKLVIDCANTDYLVGLGKNGGKAPKRLDWFWEKRAWQDGCWIGNTDGGIRLRLQDSNYKQPLTNCYYHFSELNLPEAWHNDGKGGISLNGSKLTAFSGSIAEEKPLDFGFVLQITPFHTYDIEKHLTARGGYPGHVTEPYIEGEAGFIDPMEKTDFEKIKADGLTRIYVHHARGLNPFINYPLTNLSLNNLSKFVKRAHEAGIEVLIYYTMRELSMHPAEFWAFRAMGDQILQPGIGLDARPVTNDAGPNVWFNENMSSPFLSAWASIICNGPAKDNVDLALETVPESRPLENFYLEGMRYILERCPVDGLYIDDTSISREGIQRLYRVFEQYRGKTPIIAFHAWNPFGFDVKRRDFGRCSVVLRDMDRMPHYTDLWLGEDFDYTGTSPDYYLTEISGIPFGLLSQMLYIPEYKNNQVNQWRGILYGMTSRYGNGPNPGNIWRYFDSFGTSGLKMELDAPISLPLPDGIRVTRFSNDEGKCFYALGSWESEPVTLELEKYGFCTVAIPDFQEEGQCVVYPEKGLILNQI